MHTPADPRPLLGEPLPLDLLNTHWMVRGELQDLLETAEGTGIWIGSAAVEDSYKPTEISEPLCDALRRTRTALHAVLEDPDDQGRRDALNDVLARGHRTPYLSADGPRNHVVVESPEWTIPWLAAEHCLDMMASVPDRIRRCEHPQCVLWYLDTSRSGTRRWCSMAVCGNRTKARRHHRIGLSDG